MLDPNEFLSDYGVRSLSKFHEQNPYVLEVRGEQKVVDYEPAESRTGLFGGNSNWRGPVWFPINYLLIESLQKFHHYYGDDFKVECPTGSGQFVTLDQVANELSNRLIKLFLRDGQGERPFTRASGDSLGGEADRERYFFHEYFNGDTGAGLGANHQTGWTGLVAKLIQQQGSHRTIAKLDPFTDCEAFPPGVAYDRSARDSPGCGHEQVESEPNDRGTEGTARPNERRKRRATHRFHCGLGGGAGWCGARQELGAKVQRDEAGNLWMTLRGDSAKALLIGGHIDSVPNGGWLDGSLNTLAGLEILRRIKAESSGKPPVTVSLVDWADEEGARFGKSLFGSSACSGNLDMDEARTLHDKDGISLPTALKEQGIDFEKVQDSGRELANAEAYVELHIEQGPVLLDLGLPLGAVLGTFGVERHAITFYGQGAHSGSTPMNRRKDAFLAAAKISPEIYRIAERTGGVCTIGSCQTKPGIVTSVVEECRITLDQRHLDAAALDRMLQEARRPVSALPEGNVTVSWERSGEIEPMPSMKS